MKRKRKGEKKRKSFFRKKNKKRNHQKFLFDKIFFSNSDFGLIENPLRQNTFSIPFFFKILFLSKICLK